MAFSLKELWLRNGSKKFDAYNIKKLILFHCVGISDKTKTAIGWDSNIWPAAWSADIKEWVFYTDKDKIKTVKD